MATIRVETALTKTLSIIKTIQRRVTETMDTSSENNKTTVV